ncbi:MAG TPA: hypothetical protein VII69_06675 [Candidatus Eremiobacteraceae bacterium]
MIFALIAAAAISAPTPQPLREVVYHVSYVRHTNSTAGNGDSDHGTVTVDVMAVSHNALGLKVTERWSKSPTALVALGTVEPTGSVVFAAGALKDVTYQLLPYFAPQLVPPQPLEPGVAWTVKDDRKTLTARTSYSVLSVQGTSVTISVKQTVAVHDATHSQITSSGTVVYEPRLLVPLSGDITKRLSLQISGAPQTVLLSLHFARSSDTRDPQ